MKKLLLVSLVFFTYTAATAQHEAFKGLDDKYGYKDLTFEMKETDFLKLTNAVKATKEVIQEPGLTKYKITNPKYLSIGDCKISLAIACFFKGKLMSIDLTTKSEVNSMCVLDAFNTAFGKAYQPNEFMEQYAWIGDKAFGMYKENSITHDAQISISGKVMTDAFEEFNKNRSKTNGSNL